MLKGTIENFASIITAAITETKLIFKDFAVYSIYILAIMAVSLLYSYVYTNEIFVNLPIAVVDNDQTSMSRQVTRMLDASQELDVHVQSTSLEAARELFNQEKVRVIVVIEKGFTRDIQNGNIPTIVGYIDTANILYYKESLSTLMTVVQTYGGGLELSKMMSAGIPETEAIATRRPFDVNAFPLFNIADGYGTFVLPVVFIIAIQTLQLTGQGILYGTLRERGIFASTYSFARRRFGSIFLTLGRAIPYLFFSLLVLLFELTVVTHINRFPQRGSLWEIMVYATPIILAITFLGMFLTNWFRRREDAIMTVTIFSIPTLALCGLSWPTVSFPAWLAILAKFVPTTFGVQGFVALSQFGAKLSEIKDLYFQIWALAIFYFVLACWTNRRLLKEDDKGDKTVIQANEHTQEVTKEDQAQAKQDGY
ncbi:ABC transporter permease [Myroides sp. LJL115]